MNEKQSLKLHIGISDLLICCCNILFEVLFQVFWIQKKRLSQLHMNVARCSRISSASHFEAEHLVKSFILIKAGWKFFRNWLHQSCTACSTLAVLIKNVLAFISGTFSIFCNWILYSGYGDIYVVHNDIVRSIFTDAFQQCCFQI